MTIEYTVSQFRFVEGIQSSPPLLKLLRQCPSHMKHWTNAEILQDTLIWIFCAFGFLLEPRHSIKTTTVADFVTKIRASHDASNPKTSYAIAVLEAVEPV